MKMDGNLFNLVKVFITIIVVVINNTFLCVLWPINIFIKKKL